jgi:hypothetical protein
MEINLLAVVWCAVIAMIVGAIWYGPLFGKKWMHVIGVNYHDAEARKKMQRDALPLYALQFILVLYQVFVLTDMTAGFGKAGIINAFITWSAFIMPTIAATAMWNNDSRKIAWTRFLIQSGYQLILFIIFGAILGFWIA